MDKSINEKIMQDLKVEQEYNYFGLEITWGDTTISLKNVSEYKDLPGIGKAFRANAKFILAFMCELHETNGKLYQGTNVIDAYYGKDDPSLGDDIWNSIKRWLAIAFK